MRSILPMPIMWRAFALVVCAGCASTMAYTVGSATSTTVRGPYRLRLDAPAVVAGGQPVSLRFVLTNVAQHSVLISMPCYPHQHVDFVVTRGSRQVWDKLRGSTIMECALMAGLAPNDSMVFREVWGQRDNHRRRVSPGRYSVQATVVESTSAEFPEGITSAPVAFRIR